MSTRWIGILAIGLATSSAHAGSEIGDYRGLPADLATAATAYDWAQVKSNRSELGRLLADDYVLIDATGKRDTKSEDIADAISLERKTTFSNLSDQVRTVWTDGAVLGGVVEAKGTYRGKSFAMKARFIDVWAKRNGRWQVVFTQMTDLK
jgi:Domain of unknown function (DUF4440)